MDRRAFLSAAGLGLAGGVAGCVGGGEVVLTVQRTVAVRPGQGWVNETPDASDPGGAVQFRAKASQPFDVYFFTEPESYAFYDTYTDGDESALTPGGHDAVSTSAEQVADDTYGAEAPKGGARQPIDEPGPHYFVVDHSGYREETVPGEQPEPLSVFVDLTATRRKLL
jgi:hypothetical protein